MQTGLVELLADPTAGPFTVFAPVDSSLQAVPGRMAIAADAESLKTIVQFHVVAGGVAGMPLDAAEPGDADGQSGARLFTPSLANATSEERSALSGERFAAGRSLWTLLGDGGDDSAARATLCVQIAPALSAVSGCAADAGGSDDGGGSGGCSTGAEKDAGSFRVFVGPGQPRQKQKSKTSASVGSAGVGRGGGVEEGSGLGDLFLGAFAAEVVLPNLNAANGVVHGIAGVMTYAGYKRPSPVFGDVG